MLFGYSGGIIGKNGGEVSAVRYDAHIHMLLDGENWRAAIARHRDAPRGGERRRRSRRPRRAAPQAPRRGADLCRSQRRKARPHGEAGRGGCGAAPQAWRKPRRRARAAERRAVNPAEGLHRTTQNLNQNPTKGQNQSIKKNNKASQPEQKQKETQIRRI